jgi:hypothetical protein
MYRYDTHVPLVIFGGGVKATRRDEKIDMTSLATTQAILIGVNEPTAAEGEDITILY